MKRSIRGLVVLLVVTACGDPLAETGFRGDPLLSFEGLITDYRSGEATIDRLSVSVFWSKDGMTTVDPGGLIEQGDIGVETTFPSSFVINVFEPPDAAALAEIPGDYLAGLVIVYADEDGDERMSQDELRGIAPTNAVLFLPEALDETRAPTGKVMAAGYHVEQIPLVCGVELPVSDRGEEDCGTDLGALCAVDEDCGGLGVCRTEVAGGYCVIPWVPNGCRPRNGVLAPSLSTTITTTVAEDPPDIHDDWILACDRDEDCRAEHVCPYYLGGCTPKEPVSIEIGLAVELTTAPICQEDLGF